MVYLRLKEFRARYGLSQEDMAKLLDISKASYNRKENGKIKFYLDEAKKIADFFGGSVDAIFFEKKSCEICNKLD